MWSSKYTGQVGIVSDSYHRIILQINSNNLLTNFNLLLNYILNSKLRHIALTINLLDINTINLHALYHNINILTEKTKLEEKLIWTLEIKNYKLENTIIEELRRIHLSYTEK